jgi:TPR repeat protein
MTVLRSLTGVIVAVLLSASSAMAGDLSKDFADALAAYDRQDYATALGLLRPLAEQGAARAQYDMGVMYDNGLGVAQDYAEAAKWYRKAAEAGDLDGQRNLGLMYGLGRGVPQDYVQAHIWFNLAAAQGDAAAKFNRDKAAAMMTPAQIAEAQRLAREWKPTK